MSEDYLKKSILMGLLAGDCIIKENKEKENISFIDKNKKEKED